MSQSLGKVVLGQWPVMPQDAEVPTKVWPLHRTTQLGPLEAREFTVRGKHVNTLVALVSRNFEKKRLVRSRPLAARSCSGTTEMNRTPADLVGFAQQDGGPRLAATRSFLFHW
jgi:hypothetical protein